MTKKLPRGQTKKEKGAWYRAMRTKATSYYIPMKGEVVDWPAYGRLHDEYVRRVNGELDDE